LLRRRSRHRERLDALVRPSVCLFVCLSPKCVHKNAIVLKSKQFRAMVSIDDLYEVIPGLQRMHYWNPKIQDGGDPPSWKRQIAISQGKSSDFDDIWYMTANLDDQIWTFEKTEKNCFLSTTQQSMVRLQLNFARGSSLSQNFDNRADTGVT